LTNSRPSAEARSTPHLGAVTGRIRKKRLRKLLAKRRLGIVLSEHADEDGATIFRHACKLGLEGIVSKRLSAPYRSGPSRDWIKIKNPQSPAMVRHQEGAGNAVAPSELWLEANRDRSP
jgi:ATP-dependent DNA ligase